MFIWCSSYFSKLYTNVLSICVVVATNFPPGSVGEILPLELVICCIIHVYNTANGTNFRETKVDIDYSFSLGGPTFH